MERYETVRRSRCRSRLTKMKILTYCFSSNFLPEMAFRSCFLFRHPRPFHDIHLNEGIIMAASTFYIPPVNVIGAGFLNCIEHFQGFYLQAIQLRYYRYRKRKTSVPQALLIASTHQLKPLFLFYIWIFFMVHITQKHI